jgi:hypothetical protein
MAPTSCESCAALQACSDQNTSCLVQRHETLRTERTLRCETCSEDQYWTCVSVGFAAACDYQQVVKREERYQRSRSTRNQSSRQTAVYEQPHSNKALKTALLTCSFATLIFLSWHFGIEPYAQVHADDTVYQPHAMDVSPFAENTVGSISTIFQPEVQYWGPSIQIWAAAVGLDPNLAATVMQIESCGDPKAKSRAGAMGLFQVMPFHFTSSDDPYNPDTNAKRGLAYLKRSLTAANGDARLALAGYNGGIGVIGRPESMWAAETQRYVYYGSGIYADASGGATTSLRLQEWFDNYGRSLCRQAASRLGINP